MECSGTSGNSQPHRSSRLLLAGEMAPLSSDHARCQSDAGLSLSGFAAQDLIEQALVGASEGLISDLSVHGCFICLLHLANEHSLRIIGAPSLESIVIHRT